jgi:ElaB/YqjD/DUF883 family membrane-anchored ribosome-binding protein
MGGCQHHLQRNHPNVQTTTITPGIRLLKEQSMAERLHKSSDVPDFSTYPASPIDHAPDRANASVAPLVGERDNRVREQLNERARQVGTIAGQAVNMVRRAQNIAPLQLVKDRANDNISSIADSSRDLRAKASARFDDISNQASEQYEQIKDRASMAIDDARAKISPVVDRAWDQAQSSLDRARLQAKRARNDYPVQLILAAGAVGFIAGALLRARRGNA